MESSLDAIRAQGPNLGMEDYATAAGTSKTVLYRHFEDRAGLHTAIFDAIEELVVSKVSEVFPPGIAPEHPRDVIRAAVSAYVVLIEEEPNLYQFVVLAPEPGLPIMRADLAQGRSTQTLAIQVQRLLDLFSAHRGYPPGTTLLWAHSLLGQVRTGVDTWKRSAEPMPRHEVIEALTELAWHGISAAFRPGVQNEVR